MASQVDTEPRTHEEYAVGWVCALPSEQTAATAMLDRRHAGLSKPPNDPNTYTLGSIGKHNFVIACLPKGQIGNNSAANVAAWMVSTFPSIKFGLMVGIGGGVPPKVRLGDVVVSTPVGQFPGVVQWDIGKAKEGGSFERTGSLSNPPTSLLTALTALETEHDLVGSKIPEYLEELREKWPRLVSKYLPSDLQDVLFKADYEHTSERTLGLGDTSNVDEVDDEEESCRFCDKTQIVRRRPREMAVHFGLIASGNQVIKDAAFRDKLNKDLGGHLLCIEMEAAGLMNNFPCIVVRGICDYADSHKSKDWQEYAAVVAAAFTKEFLSFLQPADVERERPVKEVLSQVLEAVSQSQTNVKKISSHLEQREGLEILNWITPINYGPQQSDFLGRRERGTGQWLLDSTQFNEWKATKGQTMFCPGMPGAGKTIISSIVVDHLDQEFRSDSTIGIAYVYCNFKRQDDQKHADLLASLLKQLARRCDSLPNSVRELYTNHEARGTRPSADEFSKALLTVAASFSKVFIIVDALDECQASERLRFLSELFSLRAHQAANIFATSRFISEIMSQFKDALSIEISATDEDVGMYLESHMGQLRPCVLENRELQKEIKAAISAAVGGMFLLAQIYLGFLDDQLTTNDIRMSLKSFQKQDPGSSEEEKTEILRRAYDQVMERINQQRSGLKQLAVKVLLWITCAKRPLSIPELQHALAIKVEKSHLDKGDLPHIGDMVSVCLGLVIVDDESSIIRLVHYTTQEYFLQTQKNWVLNAHTEITRSCITYLSFDVFEGGCCFNLSGLRARLRTNILYGYAANTWGYHVEQSAVEDNQELILGFLQNMSKLAACRQVILYHDRGWFLEYPDPRITGLHFAAYYGFATLVSKIFDLQKYTHGQFGAGPTPLSFAAENGHDTVVKVLLEKNVPVDSPGDFGQAPLLLAAENGHDKVVELLLQKNAAIDCRSSSGQTPLSRAAENGHHAVVKLLLESNAAVDSQDKSGRTPLSWAVEESHYFVVKLLLESHADVDSRNEFGRTPLSWAAEKGQCDVVELLLASNAAVDSQDRSGRAPLSWAVEESHYFVVKLLLESHAAVDSYDKFGRAPLSWAAEKGEYDMVELLLASNAAVDSQDNYGRTPLSWAAEKGQCDVVELLLASNAAVDSQDRSGRVPLSWAAEKDQYAVVELLLESNAAVDFQDRLGRTPLSTAAWKGHHDVVRLLETFVVDSNSI